MSGGGAAEKPSLPFHCLTNLSKTIGYSGTWTKTVNYYMDLEN